MKNIIKVHKFYRCNVTVNVVSSDICDEVREKRNYARSISKKTWQGLDSFGPSQRVKAIRLVLLYYAMEKLFAPDELRAATYIDWRTDL
jgi:hypothetical protein